MKTFMDPTQQWSQFMDIFRSKYIEAIETETQLDENPDLQKMKDIEHFSYLKMLLNRGC